MTIRPLSKFELMDYLLMTGEQREKAPTGYQASTQAIAEALQESGWLKTNARSLFMIEKNYGFESLVMSVWATAFQMGREFEILEYDKILKERQTNATPAGDEPS